VRSAISEVLDVHADVDAIVCVDVRTGSVVDASRREGAAEDAADLAAVVAAEVCVVPVLDGDEDDTVIAREAVVVSEAGVHAMAAMPAVPGRGVVATARGTTNVALLLASLRRVAIGAAPEAR
jgi:hypothetical protein